MRCVCVYVCVTVAIPKMKKDEYSTLQTQLSNICVFESTTIYLLAYDSVFSSYFRILTFSFYLFRTNSVFSILLTHFTPLLFHCQFHFGWYRLNFESLIDDIYVLVFVLPERERKNVPIRIVHVNILYLRNAQVKEKKLYTRHTVQCIFRQFNANKWYTCCIAFYAHFASLRSSYVCCVRFFSFVLLLPLLVPIVYVNALIRIWIWYSMVSMWERVLMRDVVTVSWFHMFASLNGKIHTHTKRERKKCYVAI